MHNYLRPFRQFKKLANASTNLTADAVGEWVKLLCVKTGQWHVAGYAGTWAHEAG